MPDQTDNSFVQDLPAFWPASDQHSIGHVPLEVEPPSNQPEVLPQLFRLAAKSDALRALQTADGGVVSEGTAAMLRGEIAADMYELAEMVDEMSAGVIRIRADAMAGKCSFQESTMRVAEEKAKPPLEVICAPMCTWRPKTRKPLHSFVAATRHQGATELIDALDASLQVGLDRVRTELDAPGLDISCIYRMNIADLIMSAGEAAGHPKHFTYFMPEDEGEEGVPLEDQWTLTLRNVLLYRYFLITEPLAEELLDGPCRVADAEFEAALLTAQRGHDLGHNVILPETDYSWSAALGIEPFMALQEALANNLGFFLATSEPWLEIAGMSRLDVCATHIAELLGYMRRGPWYYGDAGSAYFELSYLALHGFVEIAPGGEIRWTEEGFVRGMTEMGIALTRATVGAKDKHPAKALMERYGWPAATPALQTLAALRWRFEGVPTSVAFQRVGPARGEGPLRVGDEHRASFATTVPFRAVRPTAKAPVAAESLPLPSPGGNGLGQLTGSPTQPV
jgi:hypothetical protein